MYINSPTFRFHRAKFNKLRIGCCMNLFTLNLITCCKNFIMHAGHQKTLVQWPRFNQPANHWISSEGRIVPYKRQKFFLKIKSCKIRISAIWLPLIVNKQNDKSYFTFYFKKHWWNKCKSKLTVGRIIFVYEIKINQPKKSKKESYFWKKNRVKGSFISTGVYRGCGCITDKYRTLHVLSIW